MLLPILTEILGQAADTGWLVLLAFAGTLATFRLLRQTGKQFSAVTDSYEAFDFQNRLTVKDIFGQLPAYTPASKKCYAQFFIIDFLY